MDKIDNLTIKITAGILIVILVANIILVSIGRITLRTFWFIIIVGAIIAYYGIPYFRKRGFKE